MLRYLNKKELIILDTLSENKLNKILSEANDCYHNMEKSALMSDELYDILKEYIEKNILVTLL